jgi:hypothetical protein
MAIGGLMAVRKLNPVGTFGAEIVHYPRSMEMYNDAIFQLALGFDH